MLDEDKRPLSDVLVETIKTGEHTHTNETGNFTITTIQLHDSLKISCFGFKTQFITIDSSSIGNLKIYLHSDIINLQEVVISPDVEPLNLFTKIDLQTFPVQSSQDILRKVPGLFIGQHAGGGKAEQIFLRGFDIDHGTDINITVDGIPVNMVSHAHGQGYSDLHFLIPETVDKIDFGKGPYNANKGNFATAGYVNFKTTDYLKQSMVQLERGQFNNLRTLTLLDLVSDDKQSAYIATEFLKTDGPFDSPQNFDRINLFGKYTAFPTKGKDKLSFTSSYFTSKWDASGQIPQRAVDSGTIGRFGAIDDTEGGKTSRTNLSLQFDKHLSDSAFVKNSVYYSNYNFDLFSNFTFFLNDSINADQIHQYENRQLFGGQSELNQKLQMGNINTNIQVAVGFRNDRTSNSELSHTLNRSALLDNIQLGDINETNMFTYTNARFSLKKWVINPGVRLDYFDFKYNNNLDTTYRTRTVSRSIISPKLNFFFNPSDNIQFYFKNGIGFHSNDTRVVLSQTGKSILPAAFGSDLGTIWKPSNKIILNTALWYLLSQQEFIYVGDEGIVEPGGETQRLGVDFGVRYQVVKWLFVDVDINYAHARSINELSGANYIPLAPNWSSAGGIGIQNLAGFYGGIRYRFLNDRAANEDNSLTAIGYVVTDMNLGYQWESIDMGIGIQNLFNVDWNETQFATESRLKNEIASVEEIHFTPGTPFFAKLIVKYRF